jgi:hypothetical protein
VTHIPLDCDSAAPSDADLAKVLLLAAVLGIDDDFTPTSASPDLEATSVLAIFDPFRDTGEVRPVRDDILFY